MMDIIMFDRIGARGRSRLRCWRRYQSSRSALFAFALGRNIGFIKCEMIDDGTLLRRVDAVYAPIVGLDHVRVGGGIAGFVDDVANLRPSLPVIGGYPHG